jgi:hypothetical protein
MKKSLSMGEVKCMRMGHDKKGLSVAELAKLYDCDKSLVSRCLSNILYHDPSYIPPKLADVYKLCRFAYYNARGKTAAQIEELEKKYNEEHN